jgi:hypothetical protein
LPQPSARNRTTGLLKNAIVEAATLEGGKAGLVDYLRKQARNNPRPFVGLLTKVMPLQIRGTMAGEVEMIRSNMSFMLGAAG